MAQNEENFDEYKKGHSRYEALRRCSIAQFTELHLRNIAGENYDAMVDELVNKSNKK